MGSQGFWIRTACVQKGRLQRAGCSVSNYRFYSCLDHKFEQFALLSALRHRKGVCNVNFESPIDIVLVHLNDNKSIFFCITGSAVALHCVKTHVQSQWERANFDLQ